MNLNRTREEGARRASGSAGVPPAVLCVPHRTRRTSVPQIFIDGQHGTTGLQIHDRLKDRPDIELLELPMADRKDLAKRAEIARAADIAVLCLPDAAAKELVAALGDSDTVVIDASTAHRVADGWTYGFPELSKAHRQKLLESKRIANPGCYPTGAIALLRPLIDAGLVRADSTPAVFGVSGYTGGGKELIAEHEKPGVEPFGLVIEGDLDLKLLLQGSGGDVFANRTLAGIVPVRAGDDGKRVFEQSVDGGGPHLIDRVVTQTRQGQQRFDIVYLGLRHGKGGQGRDGGIKGVERLA